MPFQSYDSSLRGKGSRSFPSEPDDKWLGGIKEEHDEEVKELLINTKSMNKKIE